MWCNTNISAFLHIYYTVTITLSAGRKSPKQTRVFCLDSDKYRNISS